MSDFLIVGSGIVGMTTAKKLLDRSPGAKITVIDKEPGPALHTSGRNSGVLHAGFYYAADSLKAKFTRDGNRLMKAYCREKNIPLHECGKLVVASEESEVEGLKELKRRGDVNGVDVSLISTAEAEKIEPNVRTVEMALHSPTTASVDPKAVCAALYSDLKALGVEFRFNAAFKSRKGTAIATAAGEIEAGYLINCAGLYADEVALSYGVGGDYVMMPFKGVYLKWSGERLPVRTNIYPVPNLKNPFLGVHFTITADGHVKIGPTAIPAFWRENYSGLAHFSFGEAMQVMGYESLLFAKNSFGFRALAFEEMRKYKKSHLVACASKMVKALDGSGFKEWGTPAIRAQLMHKKTLKLEQDFILEKAENSLHVLNAVSPGFTCSWPMAEHIVASVLG